MFFSIYSKSLVRRFSNIFKILDTQVYKNNMFVNCFNILLDFVKYFGKNEGPGGPYLVTFLEVPKIIQKVLQYVWEPSHFGIIKPPQKTPTNTLGNSEKNNKSLQTIAVFLALGDPV